MSAEKRQHSDPNNETLAKKRCKSPKIYILGAKIQKRRLEILRKRCQEKKFNVLETFSHDVTHVVTDCETVEEVWSNKLLQSQCDPGPIIQGPSGAGPSDPGPTDSSLSLQYPDVTVVTTGWLCDCIKTGCQVSVESHHRVPCLERPVLRDRSVSLPVYACQRLTPPHHHNHVFTDALEVLEQEAEFRGERENYSRALAFRRASSTLKSLAHTVRSVEEVKRLPDIGAHAQQVITDILDHGFSLEVDSIRQNPWYHKMKVFDGVFGVGPATAQKWINMDLSSIDQVLHCPAVVNTVSQRTAYGLAFYDDLTTPVIRREADQWHQLIQREAEKILPGVVVTLVGGFIRGKSTGHDVDLLLSHPQEGAEGGLLPQLISRLNDLDLVLYGSHERSSFHDHVLQEDPRGVPLQSTLDHFEKWLGIVKLDETFREGTTSDSDDLPTNNLTHHQKMSSDSFSDATKEQTFLEKSRAGNIQANQTCHANSAKCLQEAIQQRNGPRPWLARRVDLVVVPHSQFYYALLGWTGSRHFNRSIRNYAKKEHNMKLSSHGLYDLTRGASLPASSEEDICHHLHLTPIPPTQRNC